MSKCKKIGGKNINKITITRSRYSRICEASFLVSILIVGIFLWGFFAGNPDISAPFVVSFPAAIAATITAITCLISYFIKSQRAYLPLSLIIFFMSCVLTALLIIDTGSISSPFVALWMLIGLSSNIFGLWGLLPTLLSVVLFATFQYLNLGELSVESIIILATCGVLPPLASLIIWHRSPENEQVTSSNETSLHNVKGRLNEVIAKSDIVINAIGDGVMVIDNVGNIRLINPAAQNIIGWSANDAIRLNYKSVLKLINSTENEVESSNDPIAQVMNLNQQIRTNELGLETKSGKKILISLVVSPIGEPGSGVIAVFRDITKEKSEEREQAEFISTASHEMRTPVASIEGYLGLALNPQTASIDIRAREYINSAHQSAQHLGRLFQDLLDVSKADDNRMKNHPQVVNIVNFTQKIVQEHMPKATEKGLRLIYNPSPDDDKEKHIAPEYLVNLDNDHIREIIDNLIENAIKYTVKGDILVDIKGSDDHVVLSVKDSGIGIPAEDMPHLFQKFYRIDNKDTQQIGGTGLGLYLCRKLAESMGGRIWAESTEGIGSTFFVQLPRISSEQARKVAEEQANVIKPTPAQSAAQQPPVNSGRAMDIIRPANSVPRGQALTPEQIAAYVAKQRALAMQQSNPPAPTQPMDNGRVRSLNIPQRPTQSQ